MSFMTNNENSSEDYIDLVERIEEAFKVYKLCENYLNDVSSDYGELKIARLRLDFARYELLALLKEAEERGIKWDKDEIVKDILQPNFEDTFRVIDEGNLENGGQ